MLNKRAIYFNSGKSIFLWKNRKGLSQVVTNMILILLILVAIGGVWVIVRNVLSTGSKQVALGQFTFDLRIKSAYFSGSNIVVSVKRNPGGGDLTGLKFLFTNSTGSIAIEKKVPLNELEEKTFTFTSTEIQGISAGNEVAIAPIYLSSGAEKLGALLDSAKISGNFSGGIPGGSPGGNGSGIGSPGTGICGDGLIQTPNGNGISEQCDGNNNLGGANCTTLGFAGGTLLCNSGCKYDTSGCIGAIPASCNGVWNPPEDVGVVCDGGAHCLATCKCPAGFSANGIGGCALNPPINNGTILSVWPSGSAKYFDSQDLPAYISNYTRYYVNFSNSAETGCFRITWAEFLDTNSRSYLRTEFVAKITANEKYYVWEAQNCGR